MNERKTRDEVITELRSFFARERTAVELLAYVHRFPGWTPQLRVHYPAVGQAVLELRTLDTNQRCRFWLLTSEYGEARLRLFAADAVGSVEDPDTR